MATKNTVHLTTKMSILEELLEEALQLVQELGHEDCESYIDKKNCIISIVINANNTEPFRRAVFSINPKYLFSKDIFNLCKNSFFNNIKRTSKNIKEQQYHSDKR